MITILVRGHTRKKTCAIFLRNQKIAQVFCHTSSSVLNSFCISYMKNFVNDIYKLFITSMIEKYVTRQQL